MKKRATKGNSLWLSCLFVTMLGCGSAPTAHRLVPPVLPPMDPETVPTNTPVQAPAAKNDALVTPPAPQPSPPPAETAAKEPGRASGPCPPPSDVVKRMLARALEMEEKTSDPEPHRAIAEAIRLRLDELFQHGCYRRLDDEHLVAAVAEMAPDPKQFIELLSLRNRGDLGILASYGTAWRGWVGQYRWHEGMIRTSILVTGEQGDMEKQLYVLTAKLAKLPSYPEPVLVLGNTHPWVSSCWRAMRLRVLAPSGDPLHPKPLLDKPTGGRWCEGITSEIKGDTVSFTHGNWGGPWSSALVNRDYTYTYEYNGTNLVERFGFPPRIQDLPEDWLMRDWKLSQEATVETERERLQPLHDKLNKVLVEYEKRRGTSDSEYSQELFPISDTERRIALYCSTRETNKPCKEWPVTVDVFIVMRDGKWYVKDVVPRQKK